jgi:hypothetical protein
VTTLRLLHSSTPNTRGQEVTATLGLDNITAVSIAGDYNNNGFVDAGDYVVWRRRLNQSNPLPNDTTPVGVTQADYTLWRSRFGQNAGAASGSIMVPEPTTMLAASFFIVLFASRRSLLFRRHSSRGKT